MAAKQELVEMTERAAADREEAHAVQVKRYEEALCKYRMEMHLQMHQDRLWMVLAFIVIVGLFVF